LVFSLRNILFAYVTVVATHLKLNQII